ncbi:MAG: TAXI family TRAP transporter solute-binding subunit, partial [bacterium]
YNFTLSGGGPGGLWSLVGGGINAAVVTAYPGSTITYQTSGGGFANVGVVSSGRAPLGLIHEVELKVAAAGGAPFKKPITNLRAIAYMYNWSPFQMVMTKAFSDKYGIRHMRDIASKKPPLRVIVNQRGHIISQINRRLFAAHGVSFEDIKAWGGLVIFVGARETGRMFSDRRIDMAANSGFLPYRYFLEVGKTQDLIMLPMGIDALRQVAADTGAAPFPIPAGSYDWVKEEIQSIAIGAELVASTHMSDADAYALTKALVEGIDRIRGVHKAMRALTPQLMASQDAVPYHSGALRYYREAGLIK